MESELVGMSEYFPYNIYLLMFLLEKGYKIVDNTLYQGNQGAIKMKINVGNSFTGNSRHIIIQYVFVKDRVEKGKVRIEYCPTKESLADLFT